MIEQKDYWEIYEWNLVTQKWCKKLAASYQIRTTKKSTEEIYIYLLNTVGISTERKEDIYLKVLGFFDENPDYRLKVVATSSSNKNQSIEIVFSLEEEGEFPSFTHTTVENIEEQKNLVYCPKHVPGNPFFDIRILWEHYGKFLQTLST